MTFERFIKENGRNPGRMELMEGGMEAGLGKMDELHNRGK